MRSQVLVELTASRLTLLTGFTCTLALNLCFNSRTHLLSQGALSLQYSGSVTRKEGRRRRVALFFLAGSIAFFRGQVYN